MDHNLQAITNMRIGVSIFYNTRSISNLDRVILDGYDETDEKDVQRFTNSAEIPVLRCVK